MKTRWLPAVVGLHVVSFVPTSAGGAHAAAIDVRKYANLQQAVDALPDVGGVLTVPAGTYSATSRPAFTGLVLPARVQIIGEGRGVTILSARGQSADMTLIHIVDERCAVKEMTLQHNGATGNGKGIIVGHEGRSFQGTVIESVDILGAGDWAIDVWGDDRHPSGTFSIHNTFRRVRCAFTPAEPGDDKGSIRIGRNCTTQWILESDLKGEGTCVKTAAWGTVIMNTTLEPHEKEVAPLVIVEDGAISTHIVNCWLENWSTTGEQVFIECRGQTQSLDVQNCHFVKHGGKSPRLLRTSGKQPARGVVILNPYYLGVDDPTGLDDLDLRHARDEVTIIGGNRGNQAYTEVGSFQIRRTK